MKYTPAVVKIVLDAIAEGLSQKDASILAGIDQDTLSHWKKQYSEFADKLLQKEIEFKGQNIKLIQRAAKDGSWQAAAWLLERKYTEEFALKKSEQPPAPENKIYIVDLLNGTKTADGLTLIEKLREKIREVERGVVVKESDARSN